MPATLDFPICEMGHGLPLPEFPPDSMAQFLQEEAEALLELQGRLQEAQDTTEALRVQVGSWPRDEEGWDTGRGASGTGPGKCLFP